MISVIIATHNRRHLLARTLAALERQACAEDVEVLVIDNASDDGTATWLRSRRPTSGRLRLRVLEEPRAGKSHAVNLGVSESRGDLLLFTDDDVVPEEGWVAALSSALRETGSDFGVGRIAPIWEAPSPPWLSPSLYGVLAVPDNGPARLSIGAGENEHVMPIGASMAVTRAVVRRIGGWRADLGKLRGTLRSGEDHEFYLRMLAAGFRGVYEPSARVGHLVPAERLTRSYFRRWMRDNGRVVACLSKGAPRQVPHVLGVPRYLWREAVSDVARLARPRVLRNPAARFASVARLAWFAGYAEAAWGERRDEAGAAVPLSAREPVVVDTWQGR